LAKNGLGYILGDFITNSSGHPEQKQFFFALPMHIVALFE
jgi:hypothetical protein